MHDCVRAGKALLFCLTALAGFLSSTAVVRAAQEPPAAPNTAAARAGQVTGRAAWDDNYVYFAFQVDDPDLAGTNTAPLSRPWEDDAIAVYLRGGAAPADDPSGNTHAMIVSAAGGFTIQKGMKGTFVPRPLAEVISIRYAVTLQGTLNRADDRDQRFTVEIAIPWKVLGIQPAPGMVLGYNAVARSRGGAFTALASGVKTEADIAAPEKWSSLTLGDLNAPPSVVGDGRFAPRIPVIPLPTPPRILIDGVLRAAEWSDVSLYAFTAPEKSLPVAVVTPVPGTPSGEVRVSPIPVDRPLTVERLLMARYALQFQGDPRKSTPFRGVRRGNGRFLLSDQPAFGSGPWFTSDRTSWHRSQLSEMRRVGVDVALAVVGAGGAAADPVADDKALMVLASALREMAAEQVPAPRIALWLDTAALLPSDGGGADLSQPFERNRLFQTVKRFFEIVPPEFRARVFLPADAGALAAYPVILSGAAGLSGLSSDWVLDLRRRFAAEFGPDTTLLLAGGEDFASASPGFAAYLPAGGAGGKGSGAISTYVIQPGYDDAAIAPTGRASLQPRREGATYREAWEAALDAKPAWLILDSWNDYARGTEVAPSRQYGPRYVDMTRIYAIQVGGLQARDIQWMDHNAPRRMRPLQVASVEVTLQNAGATPLRGAEGVALSYRWLQNGKVVAESPLRVKLPVSLFPTQVARVNVGIAATRVSEAAAPTAGNVLTVPKLEPLPPGDYIVQIDMVQTGADDRPVWFGENGDTPLSVPVTIAGDVPETAYFEATTTPPLLQTAATYHVSVRVRWQGADPLPADAAVLTYQLLSADGTQTITTGSVPLGQPLPPGQWVTLRAPLRLSDTGGSALPTAFPELRGGSFRLRWLLTRTQSTESIPGVYTERVAVYPEDYAPRILLPRDLPSEVEADSLMPLEITVVNRGMTKWSKGLLQAGYHWYFPDGIEAVWQSGVTVPLPKEVEPGGSVKVTVPVRAPARDGEYVLAFDLTRGADNWLSTLPVSHTGDIALVYLRVTGGRLTFVDLSKAYDVDAVAPAVAPGDGDLDGKGGVFPAESFPPDWYGLTASLPASGKKAPQQPPAYPSGYYADVSPTARLISFRYGPPSNGARNAVATAGQDIPIPRGRYTGLHVALAATGGEERPVPLVLRYKDGTTETVTRTVADWTSAPTGREAIAVLTHRKRTKEGDVGNVICALRHIVLPVAAGKELVAIGLPNDPAIKVFAMTLER